MSSATSPPNGAERSAQAEMEVLQETKRVSVARARLAALFDAGSFDEIGDRVLHRCDRFGLEKRKTPGDGVVTGMGTVNGRTVYAFAQDKTVLGGSLGEAHALKIVRLQDLAAQAGAPFVAINDSGGARIQEGVASLAGYGHCYAQRQKLGVIPQILCHLRPLRGWRRVLPCPDRLRLHGRRLKLRF